MKSSLKMQQIESKIADLQSQHDQLIQKRNSEVAELVLKVGLHTIDNKTLVGGLLHVLNVINTNPSQKEAWHDAGQKFLKRRK